MGQLMKCTRLRRVSLTVVTSLLLIIFTTLKPAQAYVINLPVMAGCLEKLQSVNNWVIVGGAQVKCYVSSMDSDAFLGAWPQSTLPDYSFTISQTYLYNAQAASYPVSANGSKLVAFVCNLDTRCAISSSNSNTLMGTEGGVHVKGEPITTSLTYMPSGLSVAASSRQLTSICYAILFNGDSKYYSPSHIGSWCWDSAKLPEAPKACTVSTQNIHNNLGTIDRSDYTSIDHAAPASSYADIQVNCPVDSVASITVTNLMAGGDGHGNGLIKTSIDGLGVGMRLQNKNMDVNGKLTATAVTGSQSWQVALIAVNIVGHELKPGPFTASAAMVIEFP